MRIDDLRAEILNGGWHQYLSNPAGDEAEAVKKDLQAIGALNTLELLQRISQMFPRGKVPRSRVRRNRMLTDLEARDPRFAGFCEADQAFYAAKEDLDGLLIAFVKRHREQFLQPDDQAVRSWRTSSAIMDHASSPSPEDEAEFQQILRDQERMNKRAARLERSKKAKVIMEAHLRSLITPALMAGRKEDAIWFYQKFAKCTRAEAEAAIERLSNA